MGRTSDAKKREGRGFQEREHEMLCRKNHGEQRAESAARRGTEGQEHAKKKGKQTGGWVLKARVP